jgi:hypothetical protein
MVGRLAAVPADQVLGRADRHVLRRGDAVARGGAGAVAVVRRRGEAA